MSMASKFLLLALTCFLSIQALTYSKRPPITTVPSLEKYNHYVKLAARSTYNNDFLAASMYYDSAFLYKTHPFYVDLKAFILVNSKCRLFQKNEMPIRLLMTDKKMDSSVLFSDLPKRVFSPGNLLFINKLQSTYYKKQPVEGRMQRTLGIMFARYEDALDYDQHGGYSRDSMIVWKHFTDSLYQVNLQQFLALYQEEGFPTEEKTGIFYAKDKPWATMIDLLFQGFIRSEEKTQIQDILDTQLRLGNLHPARYAALMEYSNDNSKQPQKRYNFMQTTIIEMNKEAYRPFVYYSDSLMRVVNTNRLSIGLDSFHVVQKQSICQHYCHYATADSTIIPMAAYFHIDQYPMGFVKWALEKENQHLADYKINTGKILQDCGCAEKAY